MWRWQLGCTLMAPTWTPRTCRCSQRRNPALHPGRQSSRTSPFLMSFRPCKRGQCQGTTHPLCVNVCLSVHTCLCKLFAAILCLTKCPYRMLSLSPSLPRSLMVSMNVVFTGCLPRSFLDRLKHLWQLGKCDCSTAWLFLPLSLSLARARAPVGALVAHTATNLPCATCPVPSVCTRSLRTGQAWRC